MLLRLLGYRFAYLCAACKSGKHVKLTQQYASCGQNPAHTGSQYDVPQHPGAEVCCTKGSCEQIWVKLVTIPMKLLVLHLHYGCPNVCFILHDSCQGTESVEVTEATESPEAKASWPADLAEH